MHLIRTQCSLVTKLISIMFSYENASFYMRDYEHMERVEFPFLFFLVFPFVKAGVLVYICYNGWGTPASSVSLVYIFWYIKPLVTAEIMQKSQSCVIYRQLVLKPTVSIGSFWESVFNLFFITHTGPYTISIH